MRVGAGIVVLFCSYYTSLRTNCFMRLGSASSAMRVGVGIVVLFYFVIHLSEPTVSSGWVSPTRLCELARGLLYRFYYSIIHHPEPTVSRGWVSPARLSELAQGLLYYCILLYITLNQPCQAVGFRQLGYASWRGDCCIIVIILFYHTVMDHSTSHHHTTNHWRF